MHWILQDNLFNEQAYQDLHDVLCRLGLPVSVVKVVPFVGDLLEEPLIAPGSHVMCMGSYSLRHAARARGWVPGVFDLELMDFRMQLLHWGRHMLNHDSVVVEFAEAKVEDIAFVRPIEDNKVFTGKVFTRDEFHEWRTKVSDLGEDSAGLIRTLVQVCTPKLIYSEHRFWVVDGEIVASSTYKLGRRVTYRPVDDDRFHQFVRERVAEWQPADAFVIDVCDTSAGLKVVEINTLNSAGLYAANINALVHALEYYAEGLR